MLVTNCLMHIIGILPVTPGVLKGTLTGLPTCVRQAKVLLVLNA